jgi:hypothetical protein
MKEDFDKSSQDGNSSTSFKTEARKKQTKKEA